MDEEIPYSELLVDVEDGIVVGLYHYLWMKDGKGRPCPEVNIPHTVVFTNGRPSVWYFTSGKERCIKRKNRVNISNATITEALAPSPKGEGDDEPPAEASSAMSPPSRPVMPQQSLASIGDEAANGGRPLDGNSTGSTLGPWPHHGVIARFQGSMTLPHMGGAAGGRAYSSGRRKKAQLELQDESVEWFTREQLHEVLPPNHVVVHGVAALHEGVLQRFVQPRGQHHFSIRATWSPNACVVERRTSKAKLNDPRVPLQDRLAAWDGPIWLTEHTLITGTVLQGTVCRLCDNVAAHLADVSGGAVRVLRMVLYFAVDDVNRIWLTHCGTLRTQRPKEMALAAALGRGANIALHPHLRQRFANGMPLAAALRLRMPDGGTAGVLDLERAMGLGLGGGAGAGLDLPEPSPAFTASKAAASDAGGDDGSPAAGPSGRFLCVLMGEMYPASQRCDVTYKQLLQHWFSLASQLSNEGDRLRAMDAIPLAIRRANPSLTREWYLRVRSQPTFLYRTAPVCAEVAGQLTGMALDELQRSVRPPASGPGPHGAGAGQAGGLAALSTQVGRHEAGPGGIMSALSRQGTVRSGPAALQPTPPQRPATAMAQSSLMLSGAPANGPHHGWRPGSRQQQPQPLMGAGRGPVLRSKSASATTGAARTNSTPGGTGPHTGSMFVNAQGQPVPRYMAPIGGHASASPPGNGLPSMLVPRENGAGASSSGGGAKPAHASAILQVYGPTPEQAADAAAAAAILPYEVLDEVAAEKSAHSPTAAASPFSPFLSTVSVEPCSPKARGAVTTVASLPTSAVDPQPAETAADGPEARQAGSSPTAAARASHAAGSGTVLSWGGAPVLRTQSRRNPMRMSASSETTELGSTASISEPSSPNAGPGAASLHHSPLPGGSAGSGVPTTRMSPPRSAGVLTLQTIHEEGGTAPLTTRHDPPLGEPLHFPPPSRGTGSHSVPRMRPPTRGGTDRPPPSGVGVVGRRPGGVGYGHGHGVPHSYHAGSGSTAVAHRSLSESGELPVLPGGAGGNGGNSLNSTMASSAGSMASRRSTSTQALLSNDDIRTLRELSDAYTAAERLTQQLLAQAHEILSEDGGSRAASAGTSPAHGGGGRIPAAAVLASSAASSSGASRPVSRHGGGEAGSGPGVTRQPSSSGGGSGARGGSGRSGGLPATGQRLGGLGPSPLGQSQISRQGSSGRRAQGAASNDGSALAEAPSLPPVLVRAPSALKAAVAQSDGTASTIVGNDGTTGAAHLENGLLTSAEVDLLAEALRG